MRPKQPAVFNVMGEGVRAPKLSGPSHSKTNQAKLDELKCTASNAKTSNEDNKRN